MAGKNSKDLWGIRGQGWAYIIALVLAVPLLVFLFNIEQEPIQAPPAEVGPGSVQDKRTTSTQGTTIGETEQSPLRLTALDALSMESPETLLNRSIEVRGLEVSRIIDERAFFVTVAAADRQNLDWPSTHPRELLVLLPGEKGSDLGAQNLKSGQSITVQGFVRLHSINLLQSFNLSPQTMDVARAEPAFFAAEQIELVD